MRTISRHCCTLRQLCPAGDPVGTAWAPASTRSRTRFVVFTAVPVSCRKAHDMTEIQAHTTGLTSQYIAQVTGDLERNVKEQERISAEIEALQEQLGALQHDHSVLVSMREALGGANAAA